MGFRQEEFVLTPEMREKIKTLAMELPDQETCGFVLRGGGVVSCPNVHYNNFLDNKGADELRDILDRLQIRDVGITDDPDSLIIARELISLKTGMSISGRQRLAFEKKGIAAVWHSHCLYSSPGMLSHQDNVASGVVSDVTQAKLQRLPYIVYHTLFDEWDMYDPCSINIYPLRKTTKNPKDANEYTGLPYMDNRADCFEVPRVALWGMYEIDLGIPVRNGEQEYQEEGWQRYVKEFPARGFQEVKLYDGMRFKGGDCLLMQLPQHRSLHHLALCIDEGNQRLLHVFDGRVSEIEHIEKWRKYIKLVFRHEKFL